MQRYAKTNTDYFMEENLEKLNEMVELIETENVYVDYHYYNAPKDSKLKSIRVFKDWWQEQKYHDMLELITEQDKERVIAGYKKVIEAFTKRLQTYLKKYGLSKIKSWTYWVD